MKHSAKNRQESIRHTESIQNYNKIMIINNFKNYKLMASRSKNASTQAHTHTHTHSFSHRWMDNPKKYCIQHSIPMYWIKKGTKINE